MSRDTPHRSRSERRDSNAAGLADGDIGSTVTQATTLVGAAARAHDLGGFQQRYLDRIGAMVDASAYGFYVHDPAGGPATESAVRGVGDLYVRRYEQHGRPDDPVHAAAMREVTAVDNRSLMSVDEWVALPVYEQVFRLHRMTNVLVAPVTDGHDVVGTLNFARQPAQRPFSGRERELVELLGRMLGLALTAGFDRWAANHEAAKLRAALDLCDQAVVVTDLRTTVRRSNAAARAILAGLADPEPTLEELIARADDDGLASISLAGGARLWGRSRRLPSDPDVIVSQLELVEPRRAGSHPPAVALATLTNREQEVAALAAAGLRDAEIAERLHVSVHTVKQHLKAVYSKLRVRSRVELASRLAPVSPALVGEHPPNE